MSKHFNPYQRPLHTVPFKEPTNATDKANDRRGNRNRKKAHRGNPVGNPRGRPATDRRANGAGHRRVKQVGKTISGTIRKHQLASRLDDESACLLTMKQLTRRIRKLAYKPDNHFEASGLLNYLRFMLAQLLDNIR